MITLFCAENLRGHAHRINFGSLYNWNGSLFIEAQENANITHEEHGTIPLEKGIYEVIRQRESAPISGSLKNWNYVSD